MTEPEPEGPTHQEIQEWADACSEVPPEELDPEVHGWRRCFTSEEFSETIRAAIARWGRPTVKESLAVQPADDEVAELATAEMVRQLRTKAATEKANRCHYSAKLLTRAADLLERLSPAQPIPVSERWPSALGGSVVSIS